MLHFYWNFFHFPYTCFLYQKSIDENLHHIFEFLFLKSTGNLSLLAFFLNEELLITVKNAFSVNLHCINNLISIFLLITLKKFIFRRRLNREWEQQYNNASGAVNSRTAGNQRNEVEVRKIITLFGK